VAIPSYAHWQAVASAAISPHWAGTLRETAAIPGRMRSILMLVRPYRPYRDEPGQPTLSAFYLASQKSYFGAKEIARQLVQMGWNAEISNLPAKPLIAGYGFGAYGRNGLTAIGGMGSRFAVETLLTDIPPETDAAAFVEEPPLSKECEKCARCVKMCPAGALLGDSRVDMDACLRAQAKFLTPAMHDRYKAMVGNNLWGCEYCQDACPRNFGIAQEEMPAQLREAIALERLLRGDVKALAPLIGTNYARKGKMRARACMAAGCLRRTDLVDDIFPLLNDPEQGVRDCARWALETLGANPPAKQGR